MATLITFSPTTTIKSADVNANFSNLANGSAFSTPTIDSLSITTLKQVSGLYDNGNSGASITINWANGDRQKVTISAGTTISFSGAVAGQVLTLLIVENSTGNFAVTLPTIKYPGGGTFALTTTPNAINTVTLLYDGTNYLGNGGAAYA